MNKLSVINPFSLITEHNKIIELENDKVFLQSRINELERENTQLICDVATAVLETIKLEEKVKTLEGIAEDLAGENDRLIEENQNLNRIIAQLKFEKEQLKEELEGEKDLRKSLEKECEKLIDKYEGNWC